MLSPELPFEVEVAKEPEPVVAVTAAVKEKDEPPVEEDDGQPSEDTGRPTIIEKWRGWLNDLMKEVTE